MSTDYQRTIGTFIKENRQKLGMSKSHLAQKVGIQQNTLTNVENGQFNFGEDNIEGIAKVFGVDPFEMFDIAKNDKRIDEDDYSIGQRIKHFRILHGMTQQELADLLGYSGSGPICTIEKGIRGISRPQLYKCCEIFRIGLSDLIINAEDYNEPIMDDLKTLLLHKDQTPLLDVIQDLISIAIKAINNSDDTC